MITRGPNESKYVLLVLYTLFPMKNSTQPSVPIAYFVTTYEYPLISEGAYSQSNFLLIH